MTRLLRFLKATGRKLKTIMCMGPSKVVGDGVLPVNDGQPTVVLHLQLSTTSSDASAAVVEDPLPLPLTPICLPPEEAIFFFVPLPLPLTPVLLPEEEPTFSLLPPPVTPPHMPAEGDALSFASTPRVWASDDEEGELRVF